MELRRGLLNQHVLSTPIDRVRTVDITASLIHRALGLTTVRIGTGTASKLGEDQLGLDGVRAHAAEALRSDLLHRTAAPSAGSSTRLPTTPGWSSGSSRGGCGSRRSPASGLIIAAAVLGAASQVFDSLGLWDHLELDSAAERAARLSLLVLVPVVVVGLLVIASVLSVAGYLVTNFGFTLTYTRSDHVWHLHRGLFTTRETSMDANGRGRQRRRASRAETGRAEPGSSAIVTGLDREQQGSSTLVPPAPQDVVAPRRRRGARFRRARSSRRWSDTGLPRRAAATPGRSPGLVLLAAALVVGVLAADVPPGWLWLGAAAVLVSVGLGCRPRPRPRPCAARRPPGRRSGSLMRRRVILETPAVIGWTISAPPGSSAAPG